MPLYQSGTETDKPLGSAVQKETLPALFPPRHDADNDGRIVLEDDAALAIREATWAARTRIIVVHEDNGSLLGVKHRTAPLAFNATPATIQTALEGTALLAAGDIKVTGAGRAFFYEFSGNFANKPMKRMYSAYNFVNQQQTETMTATGGDRTFSFLGQTTAALAFDASAATVQTAIQGLSTVGTGNITVAAGGAGELIFTFAGVLSGAGSGGVLTVDPTGLTGGTSTLVVTRAGSDGIKNYFETVVEGASQNFQRAYREDVTRRALGGAKASGGSGKPAPADIGNPARYNPDGSPNQQ